MYDEEKKGSGDYYSSEPVHEDLGVTIIRTRPKILTQLNHFLSRIGGEERGIERVLPHEKGDQVLPSRLISRAVLICSTPTITSRYG